MKRLLDLRISDFTKKWLKGSIIIGLLFVALVGYGVYWAFFDMNRLPTGEYLKEELSPDGKYTLKAYVTNGGATTSNSVRGELVFNDEDNKTKNIYWNYREDTANITWTDNNTVVINGHSLDIPNDKFDFRNQ
ncbi:DUF5412 domain-containing protein [Psychrobacillus sp. FSL H8-0483]|uniref:DUF5412 domain-containing protein n=1 Tax=Psychrobacillus sp. FSL H8-0483 TaxID=2921389 RepID=UPI003159A1AA